MPVCSDNEGNWPVEDPPLRERLKNADKPRKIALLIEARKLRTAIDLDYCRNDKENQQPQRSNKPPEEYCTIAVNKMRLYYQPTTRLAGGEPRGRARNRWRRLVGHAQIQTATTRSGHRLQHLSANTRELHLPRHFVGVATDFQHALSVTHPPPPLFVNHRQR